MNRDIFYHGEIGYRNVRRADMPKREELVSLPGENPFVVYPVFHPSGILSLEKTRVFRDFYNEDNNTVLCEVVFGKAKVVWDHVDLLKQARTVQ
jgi:hypothetical protein